MVLVLVDVVFVSFTVLAGEDVVLVVLVVLVLVVVVVVVVSSFDEHTVPIWSACNPTTLRTLKVCSK